MNLQKQLSNYIYQAMKAVFQATLSTSISL